MGEKCHGCIEVFVQFPILDMDIDPICAVLCLTMICQLLGLVETELLGGGGAGHAEFLDDSLILPLPQEPILDKDYSTTPSHVRLGMIRIDEIPKFYRQLRQQ